MTGRELATRLWSFLRRRDATSDMQEEFAAHLDMAVQDNLRRGMNLPEATRAARIRFGGMARAAEAVHGQQGLPALESFVKDVAYAVRLLRNSPGFAAIAIITLALGIGANTAMFSIVDAVMIRPLPYSEPDRLVAVWEVKSAATSVDASGRDVGQRMPVAPANFVSYRSDSRSFASIAGFESIAMNITGSGTPERIQGESVTADYFSVLGVQPQLGRTFLREEDRPGANHVVIVGHELWQARLAGNADLLNSFLTLDGRPYRVVGIMPPGFRALTQLGGTGRVDFLVPAAYTNRILSHHGQHEIQVVARLKNGASLSGAREDLSVISDRLAREFPDNNQNVRATAGPLIEDVTRNVRQPLLVLMGAVGIILLVACTNLANLILVRATNRRREIAMRYALGASRLRVFRESAIQCLVLAAVGGGAGLLLASATKQMILAIAPSNIPRLSSVAVNTQAMLFSASLSIAAGMLFSLLADRQGSKVGAMDFWQTARRSSAGRTEMRWRNGLVVTQVALSMVLLIGAGLMLRSFILLMGVDLGFSTDRVLAMTVSLPEARYPDAERRLSFFEELERRVDSLPGVETAAFANRMPLRGGWGGSVELDATKESIEGDMQAVSGGYFRALGISLLRGRFIDASDHGASPPVAVVNSAFAKYFRSGEDPVGKRIRLSAEAPWVTIVGLASDVRRAGKSGPMTPQVYFSARQTALYPVRLADFVFRSQGEPRRLLSAVQKEIWSIDKDQPITNVRTLEEIVSQSVSERRFQTTLLLILAGLALLLAAVGIYGVISYSVTQRTAEIGIRMALGARQGAILASVVRRSMAMVATGIAAGGVAAFGLSTYLKGLLFAITASDPLTYASLTLFLGMIGLAACWIPARRAAKLDPALTLRQE